MPAIVKSVVVDAGPLIAVSVRRDQYHRLVVTWFREHREVLLFTTLPALTEACHALPEPAQVELLRRVPAGTLRLCPIEEADMGRMADLMQPYRDRPMDMADASVLIAAEKLGIVDVLSVDHSDFEIYRTSKGRVLHNWLPRISRR